MAPPARYLERIERALALIEQADDARWPAVADLAGAAAMSEFHFHRIFRLLTGETPQQTLARARLGASLPSLAGADGIAGATEASRYATSQAYARALKALTGATPSELRADPERLAQATEAIVRPAVEAAGDPPVEVAIVALEPLRLVAMRREGDYKRLDTGYHALFERVMAFIEPEQVTGLYGVPHDDPRFVAAEDCRFDCSVTTSAAVPAGAGLRMLDIPGGSWLRLRIPGDYDRVHAALDHLYRLVLALDLPLAGDLPLNYYHFDPDEVAEDELLTDIHLKLQE